MNLRWTGRRMNMSRSPKCKGSRRIERSALLLALLLLTGTMLFRYFQAGERVVPSLETDVPLPTETEEALVSEPREAVSPIAVEKRTTVPAEESEALYAITNTIQEGYNEHTYHLVNDIVYLYQHQQEAGLEEAYRLLEELKSENPPLGELWERIMDYWVYVNSDLPVHADILPDGLPMDKSLCIVVLGFQLESDGAMAPELLGRCETALACAKKYPNAYLAVTGGGTAAINTVVTEAEVMAAWFLKQGIAEERIILENASMTTDQNARLTSSILTEDYPEIKSLAIVSSDYHIPLGSLCFEEAALLSGYESGEIPFHVVANAAFPTAGQDFFTSPRNQASYVWFLADPHYGN